jgi:ADP-ribosyl-[dinitrogen reductase] hydrolase
MTTDRRDRAVGALLGLAIGDAIGTTLEFSERGAGASIEDMIGGGPFRLKPGQWTDDTAMALCLADTLLACGHLDQRDLMQRFRRWWRTGENSCTGDCFDIGVTTREALSRFERTGDPVAGAADPRSAGNGSLMRLAPVAIFWHDDRENAETAARGQSVTTHQATAAVEACAFFVHLLLDAIEGQSKQRVLGARTWSAESSIDLIARGAWRKKERKDIRSSGYVVDTLEAALWSVAAANSFEEAVLRAANLGDDADTVAAVAGQLAGGLWGVSGIPQKWLTRLAWSEQIAKIGHDLYSAGAQSTPGVQAVAP